MATTGAVKVIVGTSVALAVGISLMLAGIGTGTAQEPPPDLIGPALAEALDLKLQEGYVEGCDHFAEVSEGAGYCFEEVVDSGLEAWEIGHRLQGHIPTEAERQAFRLEMQLGQTADSEERQQLLQQLEELLGI